MIFLSWIAMSLTWRFWLPASFRCRAPPMAWAPSLNFVSNGGRNDTAEILVDGIAAASYEPNTAINTPLFQPSVDAVQEFKIMQNNYSAEEGFSGNTYINMVMRSGTN